MNKEQFHAHVVALEDRGVPTSHAIELVACEEARKEKEQ